MSLMAAVVRIADRFGDRCNAECMDRQERLASSIALVTLFYGVMTIAMVKMSDWERAHNVHHGQRISVELMIAPPEPKRAIKKPDSVSLVVGQTNVGQEQPKQHQISNNKEQLDNKATTPVQANQRSLTQLRPQPVEAQPIETQTKPIETGSLPNTTTPTPDPSQAPLINHSTNPETPSAGDPGITHPADGLGGSGDTSGTSTAPGDAAGNAGGHQVAKIMPPLPVTTGNIAPYRNELLRKLAKTWHPKYKNECLVVAIKIGKDGNLIDQEVLQSGGKKVDHRALLAINSTNFDPLPDWYTGSSLTFNITLAQEFLPESN